MVQRSRVPAGTTVSCARKVGETSKEANPRKIGKREVLRRMVFLPEGGLRQGGHTRNAWTGPGQGKSKSYLNQKTFSGRNLLLCENQSKSIFDRAYLTAENREGKDIFPNKFYIA